MQLVEQTIINKSDPRYGAIDRAAFASKNLWNAANYLVRQSFIHEQIYLDNVKVYHLIKNHDYPHETNKKDGEIGLCSISPSFLALF